MKTTKALFFLKTCAIIFCAACILAGGQSCNKAASAAPTATTAVTEADAAAVVTNAVTPTSSGMVSQVSDATIMVASPAYGCGVQFDSSITRASIAGAAITYSSSLAWGWKLTCTSPANFSAYFKGSMYYGGPQVSSSDGSNGSFVITGIEASASDWLFNANYTRSGSQQSAIGNKNSFTSTLTIISTNIQVSKTTQLIVSGSALVNISGASTSGKSFSFSGTITFNGNQAATLVISGGGTYQINW